MPSEMSSRGNALRETARGLGFIVVAVVIAAAACHLPGQDGGMYTERLWFGLGGGCFPISLPYVAVSAHPDTGQIAPDVLVREGQKVKLNGVAATLVIDASCFVHFQPVAYQWRLEYRPPGGIANDATALLSSKVSLAPRFSAARGTYIVTLETALGSAALRVEASNGWVNVGSDDRAAGGGVLYVGRVNDVAWDLAKSKVMYAATSRGGVWRSDNAGTSWWPMSDDKALPRTLATGRIAVGPGGRIFVGTGDPEAVMEFQGIGEGVFFSDDGGVSWGPVTAIGCANGTEAPAGTVTRILVDPRSDAAPETLYVSTSHGVYRSSDGGACWERMLGGTVWDIELARRPLPSPGAFRYSLYAARDADPPRIADLVVRLDDALAPGPTWTWTSANADASAGAPVDGDVRRIALAGAGHHVYAAVAYYADSQHPDELAVYRASVAGWTLRSTPSGFGSQGGYDLVLTANPNDPQDLFVGLVGTARSLNGGVSWFDFNPSYSIYADQHALAFNPSNPSELWTCNDGGLAAIALLPSAQAMQQAKTGPFWSPRNGGMMTNLFMALSVAHAPADRMGTAGGRWDSGTAARVQGRLWKLVGGGDGRVSAYDAVDSSLVYRTNNAGISMHQWDFGRSTGGLGAIAANFWTDPNRAGVVLGIGVTGQSEFNLHYASGMTTASAPSWTCIDPTPANATDGVVALDTLSTDGAYYVGLSSGEFYRVDVPSSPQAIYPCANGSAATATRLWTTPAIPVDGALPLHRGQILGLSVDPHNADSFYATLARADRSRVVRVHADESGTWVADSIAGDPGQPGAFPADLPGCAWCGWTVVGPIAADPDREVVYVGTEGGLVVGKRTNGSWSWEREPNVPRVWVDDLRVRRTSSGLRETVRASTFGRGVWERSELRKRLTPDVPFVPNTPISFVVRFPIPIGPNPDRTIGLHYRYDGSHGRAPYVRVTPLSSGRPLPFFRTEAVRIGRGDGVVVVKLLYVGRDAPRLVASDALRVEIVDRDGRVVHAEEHTAALLWRRPDMRALSISSEVGGLDGPPVPIKTRATLQAEGGTLSAEPKQWLVLPVGSRVSLSVPAAVTWEGDERAAFAGWLGGPTRLAVTPIIELTLDDDVVLTARYGVREHEEEPDRPDPLRADPLRKSR